MTIMRTEKKNDWFMHLAWAMHEQHAITKAAQQARDTSQDAGQYVRLRTRL
jgi:hypothetical protein